MNPEKLAELAERDWSQPYRTRDASGCPADAECVGWNWIGDLAQQEREADAVLLEIQSTPVQGGGRVTRLYRSTTLLAVSTTFRDDMNFTVLVRWQNPVAASLRSLSGKRSSTDGEGAR